MHRLSCIERLCVVTLYSLYRAIKPKEINKLVSLGLLLYRGLISRILFYSWVFSNNS
jgi:hypothetical protein